MSATLRAALERVRAANETAGRRRWPLVKYAGDPEGFARDELGLTLYPWQVDIAHAVRDHDQVAVRSGQKCGKTALVVALALWWWGTRPGGRVMMTANSKEQIDRVLWRELKMRAKAASFTETPAQDPAKGLQSADGKRDLLAFTARQIEGMAGLSGDLLLIVDEASGLSARMYEAIVGNMMGGGKIVLISNPTQTTGPFFDAFHDRRDAWKLFHLNSEDVAAYLDARGLRVRGLADGARIEEFREDYGVDSPFYRMRVLGDFILNEAGKPITVELITAAEDRWADEPDAGEVTIGLDPAKAQDGDETAFAIVRGKKLVGIYTFRGLSEDGILDHVRSFVRSHADGHGTPRVIVDQEGPIGSPLFTRLIGMARTLAETRPGEAFDVRGVKASAKAVREPWHYDRNRELLFANLATWLKEGGALLKDAKLEAELNFPSWSVNAAGVLKLTPKEDIRDALGRSPDRADALALAVWRVEAPGVQRAAETVAGGGVRVPDGDEDAPEARGPGGIDPYARWDR